MDGLYRFIKLLASVGAADSSDALIEDRSIKVRVLSSQKAVNHSHPCKCRRPFNERVVVQTENLDARISPLGDTANELAVQVQGWRLAHKKFGKGPRYQMAVRCILCATIVEILLKKEDED